MRNARMTLLAVVALLVVAGGASAAFNPNMIVFYPGGSAGTMGISWVDMGSHMAGFHTWDLVVRIDATAQFPNNDWCAAHLDVRTTSGSIYQFTDRDLAEVGVNLNVARQSLFTLYPSLRWDTYAIGAPTSGLWTYDGPGTPSTISPEVCNASKIAIDWYDLVPSGPGTYHIFRLTVSDDWNGCFGGYIMDNATSGSGVVLGWPDYPLKQSRTWLTPSPPVGFTERDTVITTGNNGHYLSSVFARPQGEGYSTGYLDILGSMPEPATDSPLKFLIDLSGDVQEMLATMAGTMAILRAGDPEFDAAAAAYAAGGRTWDAILVFDTPPGSAAGSIEFSWDFSDYDGITLDGLQVIPEPATLALIVFGGIGTMLRRRRV